MAPPNEMWATACLLKATAMQNKTFYLRPRGLEAKRTEAEDEGRSITVRRVAGTPTYSVLRSVLGTRLGTRYFILRARLALPPLSPGGSNRPPATFRRHVKILTKRPLP